MRTGGQPRIAVIGTGFGGVAVAAALRRAGFDDIVLLERAEHVGGVWRDNTYPGCACDVPAPLYSYSFAPNPHWTRRFLRTPRSWSTWTGAPRTSGSPAGSSCAPR